MATTITPLNLVLVNGDILTAAIFNSIPTKIDQIVHALEDNGGIKDALSKAATAQSVSLLDNKVTLLGTKASNAQTAAAVADTKAENAATAAAAANEEAAYATRTANSALLSTTVHHAVLIDGIQYTLQNGDEMLIYSPSGARNGTIYLPYNFNRGSFIVKNISTSTVTLVAQNNVRIIKKDGTTALYNNTIEVASGKQALIAYGETDSQHFYVELS